MEKLSLRCGLADAYNISTTKVDLFNQHKIVDIALRLNENNINTGTLYLSNLTDYMKYGINFGRQEVVVDDAQIIQFWGNVKQLCSDKTVVCDAPKDCELLSGTHEDRRQYFYSVVEMKKRLPENAHNNYILKSMNDLGCQ